MRSNNNYDIKNRKTWNCDREKRIYCWKDTHFLPYIRNTSDIYTFPPKINSFNSCDVEYNSEWPIPTAKRNRSDDILQHATGNYGNKNKSGGKLNAIMSVERDDRLNNPAPAFTSVPRMPVRFHNKGTIYYRRDGTCRHSKGVVVSKRIRQTTIIDEDYDNNWVILNSEGSRSDVFQLILKCPVTFELIPSGLLYMGNLYRCLVSWEPIWGLLKNFYSLEIRGELASLSPSKAVAIFIDEFVLS